MPALEDAVAPGKYGWDAVCPRTDGSCGPDPFTSRGWPTKETALARLAEHEYEHTEQVLMSSLDDFRAKHGLAVNDQGQAVVA